jgi:hypothetical protein
VYTGTPPPGDSTLYWLQNSGALLNGHGFVFLTDEAWATPKFAFNRTFDEQKLSGIHQLPIVLVTKIISIWNLANMIWL